MKLGILVNTDRHLDHVVGMAEAAARKGHEVSIFAMDGGIQLLGQSSFVALADLDHVTMSLCEHSASQQGTDTSGLPVGVTRGSQMNNALMHREADRVIVL
jgi:predicted peroxiredoxin